MKSPQFLNESSNCLKQYTGRTKPIWRLDLTSWSLASKKSVPRYRKWGSRTHLKKAREQSVSVQCPWETVCRGTPRRHLLRQYQHWKKRMHDQVREEAPGLGDSEVTGQRNKRAVSLAVSVSHPLAELGDSMEPSDCHKLWLPLQK